MNDFDGSAAGPFETMHLAELPILRERRQSREERILVDAGCQVLASLLQGPRSARPEDVKDAVQEALLSWLRNPVTGLEPPQLRSWLRTTAERHLWKSKASGGLPVGWMEADEFVSSTEWMEQRQLLREILDRHAENVLTGRTRDALLRWANGYSAEDMARDGSMSVDNVRQKIHRGLLKLRNLFRSRDSAST